MAFSRNNTTRGTWFQEYQALAKNGSKEELSCLIDGFDSNFKTAIENIENSHNINVIKDFRKLAEDKTLFQEYKAELLDPIIAEIREKANDYADNESCEKFHLESVAAQLDNAWDAQVDSFIQESYNTSTYLPLSTLDFPALIKQYIRFLGKDIIPVQTAASTNIEQRIFIKYLVNNETGDEYETPAIYFKKDTDGKPLWKKLWNAGKGLRFVNTTPILISDIAATSNKRLDLLQAQYLIDENGNTGATLTSFTKNQRTRLSYDINIGYVLVKVPKKLYANTITVGTGTGEGGTGYAVDDTFTANGVLCTVTTVSSGVVTAVTGVKTEDSATATTAVAGTTVTGSGSGVKVTIASVQDATTTDVSKTVKIPGGGIAIDIQSGGTLLNGAITNTTTLSVVDPANNFMPTGETVTNFSDRLSGAIDFVKGTIAASTCGDITGFYIDGHISNENNLRTIGFREYPEIRKFLISDGCRFQLPFTVEDFSESMASLNFNLYNRLVQEVVTAQEMFEDESILEYLDDEFAKYDGTETDVFALESYTHTEYADLVPPTTVVTDPFDYRTNSIHNALMSTIYELCDKGKLDNLGFVIYCNPKCARLLQKFVTWTVQKGSSIGGVQMNHAFGLMTDTDIPIRVVASNRVDAFISIPAYQDGATSTTVSREYFYKIVAYPMDKLHVSYKHLRFAKHLTNSPENAGYTDAQNAGGQAVLINTHAQYKTISIQGIQGRVICKNTDCTDIKAGIVS